MHASLGLESTGGSSSTSTVTQQISTRKTRASTLDLIIMLQLAAEVLEFPAHATTTYLNEGAANIVYTINVPHAQHSPGHQCQCGRDHSTTCTNEPWHGKLLRFRKDLPTTSPTLVAHNHFLNNVAPLFPPSDLIDIKIAYVAPSGIVHRLNKELKLAESSTEYSHPSTRPRSPTGNPIPQRPKNRHGTYLALDDHALLITDMSPSPTMDLIQFKPKWLYPSFSAPSASKRCRTCALHARRNHFRQLTDPPNPPKRGFCPLDLISPDPRDVRRAAVKILHLDPETRDEGELGQVERFVGWARSTDLLGRIQRLQRVHDPSGILNVVERKMKANGGVETVVEDLEGPLQIAMTLRDVTLFLLMPKKGVDGGDKEESKCTARLGDLDLKSKGKLGEWEKIERQLINEGWYEGTEEEHGFTKQSLDCWMWPEEWTPVEERGKLVARCPE